MSITTKISTAIAGITFALGALFAVHSAQDTHPSSPSVVADGHWGDPPSPTPSAAANPDDGHWG